jgi:cyclohexadienyl dehydratase
LPLTTSSALALVLEDSTFKTTADLNQSSIRLAVNAGGHLERVARSLFPDSRVDAIPDNHGVLEELLKGRADAVVTDTLEAPHWRRLAKIPLRVIGPLTQDRKAAWFAPTKTVEAARFSRWLLGAEASGQLEALRELYGLPVGQTAGPLSALLSSLDERLTLMIAVADAKEVLEIATEDIARENRVLEAAVSGVLREAHRASVPAPTRSAIQALFQSQIDAAKWIQERRRKAIGRQSTNTKVGSREASRTQLEEVIRPALIFLGDRISMLVIVCVETRIASPTLHEVAAALERHDLPDDHLRAIHASISGIIQREKIFEPTRPPVWEERGRAPSE